MPIYELSEMEIKHIEERRLIVAKQEGYRRAMRDVRNMLAHYKCTSNENHQMVMNIGRDLGAIPFPVDMRLAAGIDAERVGP